MTSTSEIRLSGISKRFADVVALDEVDFRFQPGRVHALVGENGAGKSTLMAIAFGLVRPDRGRIFIGQEPVTFRTPRDAIRAGLGIVQQHFSLVPGLSVAENVALSGHRWFSRPAAIARVRTAAEQAGFEIDPTARVADLSVEAQQRVEIVRAIAFGANTLILDEPTAVLAPDESRRLLTWIRTFAARGGSVGLVTHKVVEALDTADDVTVLRAGRALAYGDVREFSAASLARAMFRQDVNPARPRTGRPRVPGPVVAALHRVSLPTPVLGTPVHDANLEVRGSEILGIVGVEGSGQADLLRALAGLIPAASGELSIPDQVSFVPADRHRDSVLLDFALFENHALRHIGARRGLLDWPAIRTTTRRMLADFDVRAGSERVPLRTLSGGNQQRFVLARELSAAPVMLIAENPTRGLDLAATQVILARLSDAADSGVAVVVYSSDLDEVLALADRVIVAYAGRFSEPPLDRQAIAHRMVGRE